MSTAFLAICAFYLVLGSLVLLVVGHPRSAAYAGVLAAMLFVEVEARG
ncbi:MAG: hypothetical protein U1E60_32200 [Reyranellaceae bacterium]